MVTQGMQRNSSESSSFVLIDSMADDTNKESGTASTETSPEPSLQGGTEETQEDHVAEQHQADVEETEEDEEVIEVVEEEEEEEENELDATTTASEARPGLLPVSSHASLADTKPQESAPEGQANVGSVEASVRSVPSVDLPLTGGEFLSTGQPDGDETFAALRDLESKVVDQVSQGFKSVVNQLDNLHVNEAKESISKIANSITAGFSFGGLTSGIGSLFGGSSTSSKPKSSIQIQTSTISSELLAQFSLDETEHLVESFKCKLLQTYSCNHNTFTPPIQMAFQGTLHITDRHCCFGVDEKGKQINIKVQLSSITAVTRQAPTGRVGDVLKLSMQNGQYLALKDFAQGTSALDSALALIEHLTSSDA